MTTNATASSRDLLLKSERTTRNEVANLHCRLVAAQHKHAAIVRTLDARAPGWRQ